MCRISFEIRLKVRVTTFTKEYTIKNVLYTCKTRRTTFFRNMFVTNIFLDVAISAITKCLLYFKIL